MHVGEANVTAPLLPDPIADAHDCGSHVDGAHRSPDDPDLLGHRVHLGKGGPDKGRTGYHFWTAAGVPADSGLRASDAFSCFTGVSRCSIGISERSLFTRSVWAL